MKNLLLTVFCALSAVCATAQSERNYTEPYVATVNDDVQAPESVDVTVVDNGNETVNLTFRNFTLHLHGVDVPISSVSFNDIPTTVEADGLKHFSKEGTFTPDIPDEFRYQLGGLIDLSTFVRNLPYSMRGKMNDKRLYAVLDFSVYINVLVLKVDDKINFEIGNENLADVTLYNEPLVVTINGESSDAQDADILVTDNGDGTINFALKNFCLIAGDESIPVGTVYVENISATAGADGTKSFAYNGNITIQDGDAAGVDAWMGPQLGQIPIVLGGRLSDKKLFATIDIDMQASLGQTIHVQLGNDSFSVTPGESRTYREKLVVSVNGEASTPQKTDVVVDDNGNGTINVLLKDVTVQLSLMQLPLGDFTISDIPTTQDEEGLTCFSHESKVSISVDQLPETLQGLAGNLNNVPVHIEGKMNSRKFYAVVTMTLLDQAISIVVGTDGFGNVKVYTEPLVVTVNGETSETQTTDVTVTSNDDGTINFELKNFTLKSIGSTMPVGTICVENITVTEDEDGWQSFSYNGPITIQAGDTEGVSSWMGPMLGEVPIVLDGKLTDSSLFATIDIEMGAFNQTIHVQVGEDTSGLDEDGNRVYTEQLVVTVNGETSSPQKAKVVVVDNEDGTINFILKNFFLVSEKESLPVGTIVVENVVVTENPGSVKSFSYNGPITIQAGDKAGVAADEWTGPQLGEIPIELKGKLNDEKLYATIDINLAAFIQLVHVEVGTDDFPDSIVPKTYTEPFYVSLNDTIIGPETAVVNIYDKGKTVDFELKDFVLNLGKDVLGKDVKIPFGNLVLTDLDAKNGSDGMRHFSGDRSVSISIPVDDLPDIVKQAISLAGGFSNTVPIAITVPITIEGRFDDKTLFADFDVKVALPLLDEYNAHVEIVGGTAGDLNGDGKVDIADAVSVLNIMAAGTNNSEADLNGDGKVDIADFVSVLNIMAGQ